MALEVIDFKSKKDRKVNSKKIPPLKAIEVAKKKKCFSCYCYKMDETGN